MLENKKSAWLKVLAPITLLMVILAILEWWVKAKNVPSWLFVPPHTWFRALINNWDVIWPNFLITLGEILAGYCIAVQFGVLVAILLTQFRTIGKAFSPYVIAIISTPLVILVPLLTIWMGIGIQVKIMAVTLQSFSIVNMNCTTGFNNIDPLKMELMKTVGATRWQQLKYVVLPSSLPNIFNGMRMSAISACTAALATEFYSSTSGLGASILYASSYLKNDMMFACILMVAFTGITLYLIPSLIEKLTVRWKI